MKRELGSARRFWLTSAGLAALCVALGGGCNDDAKDTPHEASGAGEGGMGSTGGNHLTGGGDAGGASEGGARAGAGGSGAPCDCGDDPEFLHVPLECAREHGLLTTIQDDLKAYRDGTWQLGFPYWLLLGSCEDGHNTLEYNEATENAGVSTYDAKGELVYQAYGPYGAAHDVCGDEPDSSFGNFGIGAENPAHGCSYCLIDAANGSAGAGSFDEDPEYDTVPCDFAVLP